MENDIEVDCCEQENDVPEDVRHRHLDRVDVTRKWNQNCPSLFISEDSGIDSSSRPRPTHGTPSVTGVIIEPLRNNSLHESTQKSDLCDVSSEIQNKFQDLQLEDEGIASCNSFDLASIQSEASDCGETCAYNERLSRDVIEVFCQDDDGDTQLHMAIIQMLVDVVFYFIKLAPHCDWLNIQNNLHQTPLHLAVITRQREIVRKLIVSGANVDPRDHKGNTPLHIACKEGFDEVVGTLLEPVYYDELKDNPYEISYQKIPQNLEDRNYDGQTCLHVAAEGTHLGVIRQLLSKGADINAQDGKSGRTVLHYAAETGNRILLRDLLAHPRINVNALTYSGLTAVTLAQGRKFLDIVECLVQAGAMRPDGETDSEEEDMSDGLYDDFCIGGEPVEFR